MPEPHRLTASAAVRDVADGRLTAEALVRSCLERIETRNPLVAAVTCFDAERASLIMGMFINGSLIEDARDTNAGVTIAVATDGVWASFTGNGIND